MSKHSAKEFLKEFIKCDNACPFCEHYDLELPNIYCDECKRGMNFNWSEFGFDKFFEEFIKTKNEFHGVEITRSRHTTI